ncbi:MAG: hypothetical protein H0U53_05670 [Actinobacteria bacterium]|nr:hypothetical protein [Actinomycetota bacterium]
METAGPFPPECGLPSPRADAEKRRGLIPEELLLGGDATIRAIEKDGSRIVAQLNLPLSVDQAFNRYRKDTLATYEVLSEDNEGFEAEIYLRAREDHTLAAVQIRKPRCEVATSAFVSIELKPE